MRLLTEMQLVTLRQTLVNFANDPDASWGKATDGWGKSASVLTGKPARVPVEQGDRNTARLISGTYTKEQYDDFTRQCAQIERQGSGVACFSGDPNNLPIGVPQRTCTQCKKSFRSVNIDLEAKCYDCVLDRLCPSLPGRRVRCFWRRDNWSMEAFGTTNEPTFWWSNRNSGGNASHQGLEVYRHQNGGIRRLVLATVASNAHNCYRVAWDMESDTTKYFLYNRASVTIDMYGKLTEVQAFDDIAVDLVVAMMPDWMTYTHRPRNPANGCFATA